jgi:hypothetical protein
MSVRPKMAANDLHASVGRDTQALNCNLLQIYKRNTNFQISTETAAIACMLLAVAHLLSVNIFVS